MQTKSHTYTLLRIGRLRSKHLVQPDNSLLCLRLSPNSDDTPLSGIGTGTPHRFLDNNAKQTWHILQHFPLHTWA